MLHVAEAARVSVATVSALINGTATVSPELTQRIEQAIRDIGYKRNGIARSLKMGTTRTIGLTVPHITNPFFTDVVSVIQQAFDRAGYAVMLCCTDEDLNTQDEQIRLLLDRMVDGLIVAREMGWPTPVALRLDRTQFERFRGKNVAVDGGGHITPVSSLP